MKKITTHSKSGLFLMEMIFVLLFLGLTCGVCVRLFAASYMARVHAREDSHIQALSKISPVLVISKSPVPVKFWKELTALSKIFWH